MVFFGRGAYAFVGVGRRKVLIDDIHYCSGLSGYTFTPWVIVVGAELFVMGRKSKRRVCVISLDGALPKRNSLNLVKLPIIECVPIICHIVKRKISMGMRLVVCLRKESQNLLRQTKTVMMMLRCWRDDVD